MGSVDGASGSDWLALTQVWVVNPPTSICGVQIQVGDKGTLFSPNDYGSSYQLLPKMRFEGFRPPEPRLPRVGGKHYEEWVDASMANDPKGTLSSFAVNRRSKEDNLA